MMLQNFYSTARLGAVRLSDGGGPLGFDITVACQIDHVVACIRPDVIVETGTFLGDTTEYFARQYPGVPVISIEIDEQHAQVAAMRCADRENVTILTGDSGDLLPDVISGFARPFVYLDAHWVEQWPLQLELAAVTSGVVAIDDFKVAHPRFSFDEYDGQPLDASLLAQLLPDRTVFAGNPLADYPYPCLQVGRRTGTAFVSFLDDDSFFDHSYFVRVSEPSSVPLR